jgi:hypothetical protein
MQKYYFEILTRSQEFITGEFTTKVVRKGKIKRELLIKHNLEEEDCMTFLVEKLHGDN